MALIRQDERHRAAVWRARFIPARLPPPHWLGLAAKLLSFAGGRHAADASPFEPDGGQVRIAGPIEDRMQLLAAISHDLRTPVTRMRLRVEMSADSLDKEKLLRDLDEMDNLVHHGIAYARGEHITAEHFTAIDIASFIDSIAYDYQDTGRCVSVEHGESGTIVTRPQALRRVLSNLIDNALKFAGAAEIGFDQRPDRKIAIWVKDRGPGIPDARLADVLEPFVRINHADSGKPDGAGLGLAIARQLTEAAGGAIRLYNREGGGLAVELVYHGRIYPRLVDPPQPLRGASGALHLDVPAKTHGVHRDTR